jgi:hypothetical protein
MAAGISDRLQDVSDIVALIDEAEPRKRERGPYKKRVKTYRRDEYGSTVYASR